MFAKQIIDYIRGKAIDYATDKVERWYREEVDVTPKAYKFLEKDVDTLVDLVYEYHAQIMVAREVINSPLVSNGDYLSVCVRVPKRRELEDLDELVREVEKLGEVSGELRIKVRARVQRNIENAQEELIKIRKLLEKEEGANKDFALLNWTGRAVSSVSRALARHQADKRQIERTGGDIQEQLAEIMTILGAVKSELRFSRDGFAVLIRDCNTWADKWNQWDYQRQPARGLQ